MASKRDFQKYLKAGDSHFSKNEFTKAYKAYLQAIAIDAASFDYIKWISVLGKLDKRQQTQVIKNVETLNKDQLSAFYNNWGIALAKQKKYAEAIEKYQQATQINVNNPSAYNHWGLALAMQGKYIEAAQKFERATRLNLQYADAYNNWGNALAEQNKYDEAIEKFQNAIRLKPNYVDPYNNWGIALYSQKKYEEAIRLYEYATKLSSQYPNAYFNWGLALYDQQKYQEAIEKYQLAIKFDPNNADAYNNWGLALYDQQKYQEAIEKYQLAIKFDPNNVDVYNNWGNALAKQSKYTVAIKLYKHTIKLNSQYVIAYNNWGNALYDQKKYAEAIEKYQRATELNPDYAVAYYNWGSVLYDQKKYAEAIKKYEEAAKLNNNDPSIHNKLGITLGQLGHYDLALEKFIYATKIDPDYFYACYNAAQYLWKQGRYAEGWKEWETAQHVCQRKVQHGTTEDDDFHLYYGSILHYVFSQWTISSLGEAESYYLHGLEKDAKNLSLLFSLVDLYLTKNNMCRDSKAYWKAKKYFQHAEAILLERANKSETSDDLLQLGNLYLLMEDYTKAEECLKKVVEKNRSSPEAMLSLGVLHGVGLEDFNKAAYYFKEASRLDPDDIVARNYLAQSYSRLGVLEKAERLYKEILQDTKEEHVESHLGLGEVYSAMGDAGDEERYFEAISHFNRGLRISASKEGSKTLSLVEEAEVLYSQGYARVKAYESVKSFQARDMNLLHQALQDFKRARQLDPNHHKAGRAQEKLDKVLYPSFSQQLSESYGPWIICILAFIVWGGSQYYYFFNNKIEAGFHALFTFGSLLFIIAGLYLPQLLKLKVGAISLEKGSLDQIKIPLNLGISKPISPISVKAQIALKMQPAVAKEK